jgi:hypothetical protein
MSSLSRGDKQDGARRRDTLNLENRRQQTGKRPIKAIVDGVPSLDGMIEGRKVWHDSLVGDRRIVERERADEKRLPAIPCALAECAEANSTKAIAALRVAPLRIAAPLHCAA